MICQMDADIPQLGRAKPLRSPSAPLPADHHGPLRHPLTTPSSGSGMVRVMPGLTVPSPTERALSAAEAADASRIASRLHADLGRLVAQLPPAVQGGSAMARHLNIVRNTTQRVAFALAEPEASLETLIRLPGVKGLGQMLDAMRARGLNERDIQLAEVAVEQFDRFIRDHAGSHAKLIARIETPATAGSPAGLGSEAARQALFEAAFGVTGRSAETTVSLYAFRPDPSDPETLQRATVTGLYRTTVVPGGMPIVIAAGDTLHWADPRQRDMRLPDDSLAHGATPDALLPEFTTRPLPTVSSRGQSGNLIQVVDPSDLDAPETLDVFTLARANHPMHDPKTGRITLDEVWSLANCASTRLVFDVFVHKDIERRVRANIDAQLWYPNLSSPGGDRWVTRFPDQPALQLLGEGLSRARSDAWPRHAELCRTLFDRIGWDPGEFVGFRCEAVFPIWRAGYCMTFRQPDA
jgi:hypothetical protein